MKRDCVTILKPAQIERAFLCNIFPVHLGSPKGLHCFLCFVVQGFSPAAEAQNHTIP
jgi:hypothetical protein